MTYEGAAAWRRQLVADIGDEEGVAALVEQRSDAELARLMTNLGGHDLGLLLDAFAAAGRDKPVCFIAYTVKGYGLPFAGHKDNHAGLMTPDQCAAFRIENGIAEGEEWEPFAGVADPDALRRFIAAAPFARETERRKTAPAVAVPDRLAIARSQTMSTQEGFGKLLAEIASGPDAARRPHRHHLARCDRLDQPRPLGQPPRPASRATGQEDPFQSRKLASAQRWTGGPQGPASRARHRREQFVPDAGRARPDA